MESLKPKAKIEPKKEPQETTKILKDEPKEKGSVKKETKQSEKKTIPSEKHAVKSTGEKTQITLDISSSNIKEDAKMVKKTSSQPETKKISEQKSPDTVKIEKPAKIEKPTKIEKPVVDDPLSDAKIISVLTETPATFMEIGKSMKLANPQQYQALKLKLTTLAMRKQIEEIMESGTKKYKKR